jgi:hypothetical protein
MDRNNRGCAVKSHACAMGRAEGWRTRATGSLTSSRPRGVGYLISLGAVSFLICYAASSRADIAHSHLHQKGLPKESILR